MKGGSHPVRGKDREWRTGTTIDHYTPVYRAMLQAGLTPDAVDRMDISVLAVMLGRRAPGLDGPVVSDQVIAVERPKRPDGSPVPATMPEWLRKRRGGFDDQAAFSTMLRGASELGQRPIDDDENAAAVAKPASSPDSSEVEKGEPGEGR